MIRLIRRHVYMGWIIRSTTLTLPLKKEIINQIIITIGLNAQPVAKKSHTAVRIFPPVMN